MSIVTLKSNLNNINRHPSDVKDKGTPLNLTAGSLTVLEKSICLSLILLKFQYETQNGHESIKL